MLIIFQLCEPQFSHTPDLIMPAFSALAHPPVLLKEATKRYYK